MLIKRRGYILLNSLALIIFISIILLGGVTIFKMNLKYSSKYKTHESMKDLKVTQKNINKIVNNWVEENNHELIKSMEKDAEHKISDRDYNIKLLYSKDKDTFKISYGRNKLDNYMYYTYKKYTVDNSDKNDNIENLKIILILKREVSSK